MGLGWNDYPAKAYPFSERLHHTHWTGETAVRFLHTYNRPEPFFLKVSSIPPRNPYTPPDRFLQQHADADLPAAVSGNWDSKFKPLSGPKLDIWHGDVGRRRCISRAQDITAKSHLWMSRSGVSWRRSMSGAGSRGH